MRIINIFRGAVLAAAGLMCACATTPDKDYTAFRESRPRSILVMPPVNQTMDINAAATFLSTSTIPLAESGYYVIPVALSAETFRQNGMTVAEEAHAIDYRRLREIFGADAALYITVTRFGSIYRVVSSDVEAEAFARLVDLRTGQEIWSGHAFMDSGGNNASLDSSSILGTLLSAAVDQVVNTLTNESHDVGKKVNNRMLSAQYSGNILFGPYHPKFGTD